MRISDWSSDVCSSDLHSLGTRIDTLGGWLSLLGRVGGPANPDFVDWLAVDRYDGREFDCGLHRHWLDPARPIAEIVYRPAQGVLVTSATLRGGGHGGGWTDADIRTGAPHLAGAVPPLDRDGRRVGKGVVGGVHRGGCRRV